MVSARYALLVLLALAGCATAVDPADVASSESTLTAAQRRVRAGAIRDAASAAGMQKGWLLAGIADAETRMQHCWSEATWACQGPTSPDCGGGPVIAGSGDGPCSIRQGGLGMFQFDAGTHTETLAREGRRILSIAGNTEAAVDFVVNMVIRSAYISGVDNRAQALAWMNGVTRTNARFPNWVKTVTHYYNGCRPSASCYPSRYARYRDHAVNVHNEMGASFWETRTDLAATFVEQSFPYAREAFELAPGSEVSGYIEMRNMGGVTWTPGSTQLATSSPRDGTSALRASDWLSPNRAAAIDRSVPPGATGRFSFSLRAPTTAGVYSQFFNMVHGGRFFSDDGGPVDNQIEVRVTVTASAATCPAGLSASWTCEDARTRARCVGGTVMREACDCVDGTCAGGPVDRDGDGHNTSVDCDDSDIRAYPGAEEVCDDGIDQNCDGVDPTCPGDDPGPSMDPMDPPDSPADDPLDIRPTDDPADDMGGECCDEYMGPSGSGLTGCSAHAGSTNASWVMLPLAMIFLRRRRQ